MLWQKEADDTNALYIDLFAVKGGDWLKNLFPHTKYQMDVDLFLHRMPSKNEVLSVQKRKEGNQLFGSREWSAAMEKYNESLCFADRESENIALAYANRSACFFRMELFNKCLADIELAKKAGYPERLMPKLDKRSTECLERIEEGVEPDDFGSKLTLDPHETFPCMANVLKFERDADGSYSMFAKEDIAVGQTIVLERAFSTRLYMRFGWRCSICLKTNCNLMPCEICTEAMFCSKECRDHFYHYYECDIGFTSDSQLNGIIMHELRLIMQVIEIFANADEMMGFVEAAVGGDPEELPESLTDEKSRYRAYLKLPIRAGFDQTKDFVCITFAVYSMIMSFDYFAAKFKSQKHRRFLMHLITVNLLVSDQNSIRLRCENDYPNLQDRKDISCHTALTTRYFKHSCAPNVAWTDRDGYSVYYTIRPVKKGEQLFITILNTLLESTEKRQQMLLEFKELVCKCTRCEGIVATPDERQPLRMDPNYAMILHHDLKPGYKNTQLMAFIDKCVAFLNKYGHLKWCDEIGKVAVQYVRFQCLRLAGPIHLSTQLSLRLRDLLN